MGVYSTITISRENALEAIQAALLKATNEQLADTLFALYGERTLHNFTVADDRQESNPLYWDMEYD